MDTEIKIQNPIVIPAICMECKKRFAITVSANDYLNWKNGMLIQKAFPYLTAEMRELLISHICPECWNIMFKDIDE